MSMTEEKLRGAVRAAIQRLAEKNGKMPMKDEPEGKDLNKDGKKGHGKVPAFLKQEEAEQVEEGEVPDQLKPFVKGKKKKDEGVDDAKDDAEEEGAEGKEEDAEKGAEELDESPSHPAGERKEVAESADELKEWYLGTLSEALVKRFTK